MSNYFGGYFGDSGTGSGSGGADADAIWDELLSGHTISGSAGAALSSILSIVSTIGSGRITVTSPVAQTGTVRVIIGDAYTVALGRSLTWTESSGGWPVLTDADISLEVEDGDLVASGEVVTATGSSKVVRVELSSTDTNSLPPGELQYNLVAMFASSRVTLARGKFIVYDREDS